MLLIVGFIVMFTGALAVELVANLVSAAKHSVQFLAQVVVEETLEMLMPSASSRGPGTRCSKPTASISASPSCCSIRPVQSAGS